MFIPKAHAQITEPIPVQTTATFPTIGSYAGSILTLVMFVAVLLVLSYLVWGAIEWITAGGDSGKVQKAREKITGAVIGIIVLAASTAILILIQQFLGINAVPIIGGASGGGTAGSGSGAVCVPSSRLVNDGGAGGYCSGGGAAMVRCVESTDYAPYPHYEPCSCVSGTLLPGYSFEYCN